MLDFRYAEIGKSGGRTYVYFYAKNPETEKLERVRKYISYKSQANIQRHARNLVNFINNKLDQGWNPFMDDSENKKKYSRIEDALDFAYNFMLKYIRERSKQNYKSRIKILKDWLKKEKRLNGYIFEFTNDLAINFMDNLLMTRDISPRTFNNYLLDYRTIFNLLKKKNYLYVNPFHSVEEIRETESSKRPWTHEELVTYFSHIALNDYNMYIVSLYIYYCGLRPAEICRLNVRDINFKKGLIKISGAQSKNKKSGIIPIANEFKVILEDYLNDYPGEYLICSKGFGPGLKKIAPTRIADKFREIREQLGFSEDVKIYALKDTAADKLLEAGFDIKVLRDLYRHHNIAMTHEYLKKINPMISNKLISDFPSPV